MSRVRFITCWTWPLALAVASAAGLVGALLMDGAGDLLSAAALSAPLVVAAWHIVRAMR